MQRTMMTSRQRLLCALERKPPDRLPVTTHHLMDSFLQNHLGGASNLEFFDRFGLDAIDWVMAYRGDEAAGILPEMKTFGRHDLPLMTSPQWRVEVEDLPSLQYPTQRCRFITPKGELSLVLQGNEHTLWVVEHLIKNPRDIDLIGEFMPSPLCDIGAVNARAEAFAERGIVRGHVCSFDLFGQPGCWQDAACLVGIEKLILDTYDDPEWVHELLKILQRRKLDYVRSLGGARYDLIEFGGGDASATVISPPIFDEFVAPYDQPVIAAAHDAGQRIVYHTCGGMMPFLERLADMGPDAMETFTPVGMGGDARLGEAKRRIGDRVCMIGGFDQLHFFTQCTPEQTRAEVRRCFAEAGGAGGFILSPSDHFFDAEIPLLEAFADEARQCLYPA